MNRRIWIINHYAGDTFFDKGGRHYWIAKYLKKDGYEPVVFCCNKLHNTNRFCFDNNKLINEKTEEATGVPYVFLRGRDYVGNGKNRVLNMLDFYWNLKKVAPVYAKQHGKPDIIYASSVHPLALVAGIQLARKFGVKCVCEIRDLWPDSIVAVGMASKYNPVIIALYLLEKWTFKNCDALITTFEGGYDYIRDKKYTSIIPKDKVFYINNGIDLEEFDESVRTNTFTDNDLDDNNSFKVIYTGSLRLANGLDYLLGCAKELLPYEKIKFLVYGGGDMAEEIQEIIEREKLTNVTLKGKVEKKYVPYVLSKGNLNMLNYNVAAADAFFRYGSSQNKLFEYLASGRPIISNSEINYDIIQKYKCGISKKMLTGKEYADALLEIYEADEKDYQAMCNNAREAAYVFDFRSHTKNLINIFKQLSSKEPVKK